MKFLALVVFFMSVSLQPAYAGWIRKDAETIRLDGDIDENSYSDYLEIAKTPFTIVELDSGGGYPFIALKIAQDIANRNVKIVINKDCFSACANYLALAGRELIVPCNALIGWHGSPTLESDAEIRRRFLNEEAPNELIKSYTKWLGNFRNEEVAFYKSRGISTALLVNSTKIPEKYKKVPSNSTSFTFNEQTGQYSVNHTSVASIWLPTKDTLAVYGFNTSGFCKTYDEKHIEDTVKDRGYKFNYTAKSK